MVLDVKVDETLSTASAQLGYDLRPDQELAIKDHPRNEEVNRELQSPHGLPCPRI